MTPQKIHCKAPESQTLIKIFAIINQLTIPHNPQFISPKYNVSC